MRIHLLLLFFCSMLVFNSHAQLPTWTWAHADGDPVGYENTNAMAIDISGSTYVAGQFNGLQAVFDGDTIFRGIPSGLEGYIVKHDASGNEIWALGIHGYGNALVMGMRCDISGNLIVTGVMGVYIAIGTDTLFNTGGGMDAFLMKLDMNGTLLWWSSFSASFSVTGVGVTTNGANEIFLTGYYSGTGLDFGTGAQAASLGEDVFTAHFDPSGNCLGAMTINDPGNERVNDIAFSPPNGGIVLTGVYIGSPYVIGSDTLPASLGGFEIFVASLSSTLAPQWALSCNGNGDDVLNAIATDGSGRIYGTGFTDSGQLFAGPDTITNTASHTQIIVIKIDFNGGWYWSRSYGAPLTDESAHDVSVDLWGFVSIVGNCFAGTTFGLDTVASTGGFATRFTPTGNPIWAVGYGPLAGAWSCGSDMSDNLVISGGIYDTCSFGPFVVPVAQGNCDIFLAQLDVATGISETPSSVELVAFPNPASAEITLTNAPDNSTAEIYNVNGQLVRSMRLSRGDNTIYVGDLVAGLYFIRVNDSTIRFIHE